MLQNAKGVIEVSYKPSTMIDIETWRLAYVMTFKNPITFSGKALLYLSHYIGIIVLSLKR